MGEPPSRTGCLRVMWKPEGFGDTLNEDGTSGEAGSKEGCEITNIVNQNQNLLLIHDKMYNWSYSLERNSVSCCLLRWRLCRNTHHHQKASHPGSEAAIPRLSDDQ